MTADEVMRAVLERENARLSAENEKLRKDLLYGIEMARTVLALGSGDAEARVAAMQEVVKAEGG